MKLAVAVEALDTLKFATVIPLPSTVIVVAPGIKFVPVSVSATVASEAPLGTLRLVSVGTDPEPLDAGGVVDEPVLGAAGLAGAEEDEPPCEQPPASAAATRAIAAHSLRNL